MATTHNLQQMTKLLGDFVVKNHGAWNHDQWEALCENVTALGVDMDGSLEEHLGLLLEHLRVFYFCMPLTPQRKTKAKAKTKTKAKSKPKTKAKKKATPASSETS